MLRASVIASGSMGNSVLVSSGRTKVLVDAGTIQPDLRHALKVEAPFLLNDSESREVHFVKPEIIFEIGGDDWIHTRAEGTPCRAQAFERNEKKSTLTYAAIATFSRLVFPTVSKLRDYKSIADGGVRIAQVLADAQPPAKPYSYNKNRTVKIFRQFINILQFIMLFIHEKRFCFSEILP